MKHIGIVATLASLLLLAPLANGQPASPPFDGPIDALLAEVRLLRQAIERQGATATRAQVLVGRLTLQDQRIARARAAVERVEKERSSATQESVRTNSSVTDLRRMIEGERDSTRRAQLERELKFTEPQLKELEALVADLELRHTQAVQALAAETAQLEQLETLLGRLDRDLERSK
jgi:chromosome segregation ATPase